MKSLHNGTLYEKRDDQKFTAKEVKNYIDFKFYAC